MAQPSPLTLGLVGGRSGEVAGGRVGGRDTGQSYLSQITFLCDLLLLYVDGEAHFYWRTKYEEVSCWPAWRLGSATLLGNVGLSPDLLSLSAGKSSKGDRQP